MKVFLADEASPVVTRYQGIGKEIDFPVDLLLTATGSVETRVRQMSRACEAVQPRSLFVDSGAFILISAYYKHGRKPSASEVTDILRNHLGACDWLQKNGYPVYAVGEMDLQEIYGDEQVDLWRAKYTAKFENQTGIPVVYCWHATEPIENLIQKPFVNYLGMSLAYEKKKSQEFGYKSQEDYLKDFGSIVMDCYNEGLPVHGYAVTWPKALRYIPFTSVDSITWQAAIHFGNAMVFTATGDMVRRDVGKRAVRKGGAAKLIESIMDMNRHGSRLKPLDVVGRHKVKGKLRSDSRAIFIDQAMQYHKMAEWYTEFWRQRGVDWENRQG